MNYFDSFGLGYHSVIGSTLAWWCFKFQCTIYLILFLLQPKECCWMEQSPCWLVGLQCCERSIFWQIASYFLWGIGLFQYPFWNFGRYWLNFCKAQPSNHHPNSTFESQTLLTIAVQDIDIGYFYEQTTEVIQDKYNEQWSNRVEGITQACTMAWLSNILFWVTIDNLALNTPKNQWGTCSIPSMI